MAHKMVRQPSETPNINNIDDIVPFRYAYGNQDGYVIGKGNELSHTINGNEFRINSGRVVLQGVEDDIDANGVTFIIDNIASLRYYVIYYRVNLATNTTSYEITYDTVGYPTIDVGDDLTKNSSGSANLPLYRFTASSGVISGVEKLVKAIEYSGTALVGYDIDKGTVEERLTRLGFREGVATFSSNTLDYLNESTSYIRLYRQGNYVILKGKLSFKDKNSAWSFFIGNSSVQFFAIPKDFLPLNLFNFFVGGSVMLLQATGGTGSAVVTYGLSCLCQYTSNGIVNRRNITDEQGVPYVDFKDFEVEFSVGYEAIPIE